MSEADPYTTKMRLCDDAGMVSDQQVADRRGLEPEDWTYLNRLNRLRRLSASARGERLIPIQEEFSCTGHAHLTGEHVRCTSPAHGISA